MLKKRFIVDDWGMSPAINEAALYLAEQGYLYGISVIPESRFYNHKLREIMATGIRVGCHTNFTFQIDRGDLNNRFPWALIFIKITGMILSCLWPPQRRRLFSELALQVGWVEHHCGRIDYLDGHHHIHLYPGIFGICRSVCNKKGIPYRVVRDCSFKTNFILSLWSKVAGRRNEYFECLYLVEKDLKCEAALLKKISKKRGNPIVIHPSSRDDFREVQVKDHYSAERVREFNLLKGALKI